MVRERKFREDLLYRIREDYHVPAEQIRTRLLETIWEAAEAPIFEVANYGIVGNLFEVLPVLTAEIQKLKG